MIVKFFDFHDNISRLTRVDTSFSDIPDSSSLNNVTDDKLLDSLVLGYTTGTVCAANGIGVATAVFRSSIVAAFARLHRKEFV